MTKKEMEERIIALEEQVKLLQIGLATKTPTLPYGPVPTWQPSPWQSPTWPNPFVTTCENAN